MPTDKTVLVTGGGGFIGSHLVDALVPGNEVRVVDDWSTGSRERVDDRATVIEADVRDASAVTRAMSGVDYVFHEAAQVSVERSIAAPRSSHAVTVDGTITVLDAARDEGARVIAASSCAIYGHPERVPIPETAPTRPTSPYAIDKLAVDHYVRRYAELYDLPTVALRYFNVYGPRQPGGDYSGVIGIFREQARSGGPLTVEGDGSQTRDFVHVADIVRANLLAMDADAIGQAVNIGTGTETSILDLAERIREACGTDPQIEYVDPRPGDIERSAADLDRAAAELGYEPTIGLRAGIGSLAS